MFDIFGEFNSVEELNLAAKGFLDEGDLESLRKMAVENGIDSEDTEDYINGDTSELATLSMAAMGRLTILEKEEIETKKELVEKMPLKVILAMLKTMMTEQEMQAAVMKKGKRMEVIYKAMRKEAQEHKSGDIGISCGTDRQLCKIIKTYYTDSKEALKKVLASLYDLYEG